MKNFTDLINFETLRCLGIDSKALFYNILRPERLGFFLAKQYKIFDFHVILNIQEKFFKLEECNFKKNQFRSQTNEQIRNSIKKKKTEDWRSI